MPKRVKTSDFFQYEMKQVIRVESEKRTRPGPASSDQSRGVQAVSDWHRNKTIYFINGKSVKEILLSLAKTDLEEFEKIAKPIRNSKQEIVDIEDFNGVDGLKEFFDKYLLCNIKQEKIRDTMRDLALDHFIQSGLPHAADTLIFEKNGRYYASNNIMIRGTEGKMTRLDFIPLEDGVGVKEQETYHAASSFQGTDAKLLWRNSRLGGKWERYFIKTKCETSLTVDQNLQPTLTLIDLSLDVSDSRFRGMFDQIKISFYEWIKERLNAIMNKKGQIKPIVIYPELNSDKKETRIDSGGK